MKKLLFLLPLLLLASSCFWQSGDGSKPGIVAFTASPATIGSAINAKTLSAIKSQGTGILQRRSAPVRISDPGARRVLARASGGDLQRERLPADIRTWGRPRCRDGQRRDGHVRLG